MWESRGLDNGQCLGCLHYRTAKIKDGIFTFICFPVDIAIMIVHYIVDRSGGNCYLPIFINREKIDIVRYTDTDFIIKVDI